MNEIHAKIQEKGNVLSHGALWLLLASGTGVTLFADEFGIATKEFVHATIGEIDEKVEDNTDRLDQLLAGQTAAQIDKILRYRCMTGSSEMDDTLRRLEAEYKKLTKSDYQRPSCEFLLNG